MTAADSAIVSDRSLSRQIAALMRWGTLAATIMLIFGVILAWCGVAPASSVAVVCGCSVLIFLPFVRLLIMLISFSRRADKPYVGITALVLVFIIASAINGMIL